MAFDSVFPVALDFNLRVLRMLGDPSGDESLEKTAYHESGHAVCATLGGGIILNATLEPDPSSSRRRSGEVSIGWGASIPIETRLLSILAGPVAEMIYSGDPLHPGLVAEWTDDWEQAWELAGHRHAEPIKRLRYLEQLTAKLYLRMKRDDLWAAIASVADLLLAHDSIEHDALEYEVSQWIEHW